jgi:hypothetical protein
MSQNNTPGKQYWLDRSENVTLIYRGLWVVGIVLLVADLVVHRHEEVGFAKLFGFYGFYGFFACVALVLAAKVLRKLVMRREDYYER